MYLVIECVWQAACERRVSLLLGSTENRVVVGKEVELKTHT
jgi:hypothetical protein